MTAAQQLNWPQLIAEAGIAPNTPVQGGTTFILDDPVNGKLDTGTLGTAITWADISAYVRSGSTTRPGNRQQGPLWSFPPGTASLVLKNGDGRFDPDNLSGPYTSGGVTQLNAMVPVRVRATWNGITYGLFWGFADSWDDDGVNYAGRYAQTTLAATDGQNVLNGITLPATGAVGAGEDSGARVTRILNAAQWYTGSAYRSVATGNSTVQAYAGGDTAWNLMQVTADSEIGELYVNGSGQVVFRNRQAILTDTRSNTSQATFSDSPASGIAYTSAPRSRDAATLANDVQATRTGGSLQEAQDATSIAQYLFPRTYARSDLILQDDPTALQWAQWTLYISKFNEDRFDTLVISPLRDPADLWPQCLGREIGDRITVIRNPPGAGTVTKDVFIRGIAHAWDWSAGTWQTTFTLQDATKYGSFLVLDNPILGQLDANALAFLSPGAGLTVKQWNPGDVLTAADMNAWTVPLAAIMTSTQHWSNNTVTNVTQLVVAVAVNAVYDVRLTVSYEAPTAGDGQLAFTLPAGASQVNTSLICLPTTAAGGADLIITSATTTPAFGGLGAGTEVALEWKATLTTAGTAGNFQVRAAQNVTSAVSDLIFNSGSSLILQRIG